MLSKIKEFQRQANELKRDENSVDEFRLWLEAKTAEEKVFPENTLPRRIQPGIRLEIPSGDIVKVVSKPYDYMDNTVIDIVFDNGLETTAIWYPEDSRWDAVEEPTE
jgi:hypothetical protein